MHVCFNVCLYLCMYVCMATLMRKQLAHHVWGILGNERQIPVGTKILIFAIKYDMTLI